MTKQPKDDFEYVRDKDGKFVFDDDGMIKTRPVVLTAPNGTDGLQTR